MKLVIVVAALLACAAAAPAPQQDSKTAYIVKQESDNVGLDGYSYSYETSDGTSAQEQGQLQNAGSENESIAVRGQFSFIGPDGVTYTVIVLAALLAVALARPQNKDGEAYIVRSENNNIGVGGYNFNYETSNGVSHDESAELRNEGREDESIAVRGQYSFVGPDGVTYTVTYIADENGFQPQ
ncbi:flexible cuticle protein 12, partial [Asbolus verrucosus]